MHVKDLRSFMARWALVLLLCASVFPSNRNTPTVSQPRSTVSPLSISFIATSIHTEMRTHTHTCTFNTVSPEPPLILRRISVYYGISPNWVGSSEIYCALKALFSTGWRKKDEMRGTGNDRASVMCSVKLQHCVFYWGETRVKSVILASMNAYTVGSAYMLHSLVE